MFATPDEAEHAFYEALEQADADRLMQIWADDEEVVCIHPGGLRIVGHTAVRDSWQQVLANGPLHIRPLRPVVVQSMMCAVHILVEQITVLTREAPSSPTATPPISITKGRRAGAWSCTMPPRRRLKRACWICMTSPTGCTRYSPWLQHG